MTDSRPRILRRVHASPGRLRLRLPWLRKAEDEAAALADVLSQLVGVERVEVRPRTGSVLCLYDEERLAADAIAEAVCAQTGAIELAPGEAPPLPRRRRASALGRVLARSAAGINEDILDASGGSLDLGTLAALGFLALGAGEVAVTRTLPIPQWSSLAWWAFRTFTEFELEEEAAD